MSRAPREERLLLLSIRPNYAEAILSGVKTVELRRRRPKLSEGRKVLIYASGGTRALVGAFAAEEVIEASPRALWRDFGGVAGISRDAFHSYFAGKETGVAISIAGTWRAPYSVALEELRRLWPGFAPPQSYRYLDATALRLLPGRWKGLSGTVGDAMIGRSNRSK